MYKPISLIGTGFYVPKNIVKNPEEKIFKLTGILERRRAEDGQAASDLALEASKAALSQAHISPKQLDLIIGATITPDYHCPCMANVLEAKLKADNATSFDISAGCSGFIFALDVASRYLNASNFTYILVVAAEVMTRTLGPNDYPTSMTFGDGAGAAVLKRADKKEVKDYPQLLSTYLATDGNSGNYLLLTGGGSAVTPISIESVSQDKHYLKIKNSFFTIRPAINHLYEACKKALDQGHLTIEDIALIIPHQVNLRILKELAERLGLYDDFEKRFYININRYGNVSSASVAIGLAEALSEGRIKRGDMALLVTYGGGLTWASAVIRA
ncbi:MAG: hypothetical protein AMJ45_00880 [Syntrophobacter sp. DG_60]|nr:MAG: hypothetical protein AMJ45_00880 [Syntrophobacter sp. DG_60]